MERGVDNYQAVRERWRDIFAGMDHEELKTRFSLEEDGQFLYITYFQQRFSLDKKTGEIAFTETSDREISFNTAMAIYHLFYYSRPEARVKGEFVPFRQVKRAAPFEAAYKRNILEPFARTFGGHMEELANACRRLGGKPIPQGDVGFVINVFSCMPLTVVFWDRDEEFEAQANILFDADITDYLHEETVVLVAEELTRRLVEEAGANSRRAL